MRWHKNLLVKLHPLKIYGIILVARYENCADKP